MPGLGQILQGGKRRAQQAIRRRCRRRSRARPRRLAWAKNWTCASSSTSRARFALVPPPQKRAPMGIALAWTRSPTALFVPALRALPATTKTRSALRTPTWWIQEPGAAVPHKSRLAVRVLVSYSTLARFRGVRSQGRCRSFRPPGKTRTTHGLIRKPPSDV